MEKFSVWPRQALKCSAKMGLAYHFKARLIVLGFERKKTVNIDYNNRFSPTKGNTIGSMLVSTAIANDLDLHTVDLERSP